MIRNGIWDLLYLPYPQNEHRRLYLIQHQSRFLLEFVKRHVKSLQKGSKVDQCVVQNLMWSGLYLYRALSNDLIQKVITLMPLIETEPEVYVAIITTFLSNSYDDLEETLTHTESIKLKSYPGDKVEDFCTAIFIDSECLESARVLQ